MSSSPILTVIIPTANRPHYLPRAIDSALASMPKDEIEVIVVPNGPDQTWQQSLRPYQNNQSVRIIPIVEANANIARNTGLINASGEFVRFLDDDDYLIPAGVRKQLEMMLQFNVDLVSGTVELLDPEGQCFETWQQPDITDFCVAMLGPWRKCHVSAHLYRHSLIKNNRWRPETTKSQDLEWIFDLCASKEVCWHTTDMVVGIWQHHWEKRISSSMPFNQSRKNVSTMLTRTYSSLLQHKRLTLERKHAMACGLLSLVHEAFFLEPFFWQKIAKQATQIDLTARPIKNIYRLPVFRLVDPIVIQWLLLPKRWVSYQLRTIMTRRKIRFTW